MTDGDLQPSRGGRVRPLVGGLKGAAVGGLAKGEPWAWEGREGFLVPLHLRGHCARAHDGDAR